MATNRLTENDSVSVGELVQGIVKDLEALATQHVRLFKKDLKEDFQKLREATMWLAVGLGVLLVGGALLGLTLVHGLLALNPDMHEWVAYALVTAVYVAAGAALLALGRKRLLDAAPLAERTMETIAEDVKWASQPK